MQFSERHIQFGKGQMQTVLTLAPRQHALGLLLADPAATSVKLQ
ncbi:MAG: DUF4399 domain-containing protein [Rhodoferax sp.]|nr:DUF4399 domain-containing protein [Rhodoferax sp.]